ncbi:F0F1 ATP synthase subunit A [Myxococcota bacterium]|nr:F0F1 ATP synthase subunit A [Myxococcota bacterium]MBU1431309.1 F0F1 ATP synthase subunit A [Myxococcota bacterium]MBU1898927.1 F0F1 ATP synthase subunit A [Myxococcota bacterium]
MRAFLGLITASLLPASAMASGGAMEGHETWLHVIPGVHAADQWLNQVLGAGIFGGHSLGLSHVIMSLVVFGLLYKMATAYNARLAAAKDAGIIPEDTVGVRAFVELILEAALGMMTPIMGEKAAKQFLPLIGTMALFILTSNLLGLVPGLQPATSVLSTTAAAAIIIFVATHLYGWRTNGIEHVKHLMGPIWWLAPLMFPIEVISHLARPMSLSLRLMGNMVGDHTVLAIFLGLVPLIVPIPIMVLGLIVCIVQTLVFCLLSVVYIGLAIEKHHHEEHGQAAAH